MDEPSGFLTDIDTAAISHVVDANYVTFLDVKEVYASASGHTRLLSATRYGRRYMLKCLKTNFLLAPLYQQLLRKEFEIGIQLDHPNICRTIGWETLPSFGNVIVMEHVDGITFEEFLHTRDKRDVYSLLAQLVDALGYMHSKQIVHRDLKPSNIMVTHNGNNLKIIDFSFSDSDAFSILKSPAGTRQYAAPEQFVADVHTDVRSDIYSFGVIVAEIAGLTHDNRLHAVARRCMQHDINQRPTHITDIIIPGAPTYNEKPYTIAAIILSITAMLLLACIIYLLVYDW